MGNFSCTKFPYCMPIIQLICIYMAIIGSLLFVIGQLKKSSLKFTVDKEIGIWKEAPMEGFV